MSIEQQIEELRCELLACGDPWEAKQIEAQLSVALALSERLEEGLVAAIYRQD